MPQRHFVYRVIPRLFSSVFYSVLILCALSISVNAQKSKLASDLDESFSKYNLVTNYSLGNLSAPAALQIPAAETNFELELVPRDLRASKYRTIDTNQFGAHEGDTPTVRTYKGRVRGESRSEVRLSITDGKIEGYFVSETGKFFIEPASRYSKAAGAMDSVVYQEKDLKKDVAISCGSELQQKIERGEALVASQVENLRTVRVVELATEADYEFVSAFGSSVQANNEILSVLNMVEGVYEEELGLNIDVVLQHTWSTPDPFGTANADAVLRSFKDYWNVNFPLGSYPRDAAHIWTAKPNSLSQGYAFIGVICSNPSFAYGLTGKIDWAPAKFDITAHELAHNLSANHADAPQGCSDTVMNSVLSVFTPLTFCQFSRSEVTNYVNVNSSCLAQRVVGATRFDFDGDSKADIAVFRPSNGVWFIANSNVGFNIFSFGQDGDRLVPADYDGDGKTDAGIYREGFWYRLNSSTTTFDGFAFGLSTDVPAPADFDGDGKADVAVFRPSEGNWYVRRSSDTGVSVTRFGANGDVPMPGDYDGDGKADITLWRPSTGAWYRLNSGNGAFFAAVFGESGDKPVSADFDGDGKLNLAVWRPSTGFWYSYNEATQAFFGIPFGLSTDSPAPADFDGDGKTDLAVFRPGDGTWHRMLIANGSYSSMQFGIATDKPVAGYYVP